jgi:hypothetical protein
VGREILGGEFTEDVETLAKGDRIVLLLHLVQDRVDAILIGLH